MSQQIQITGGAKVRDLQDVIIGTSGVLSSLAFDVANGVPRLDVNGKILVSQLPNSVMEYKGTWNASTNTPTLANGTGNQGDVYLCNVAGTVDFGAGPIAFVVGDQVIYSGSIWQRASGATGTVTSVAITESGDSLNITGSPITTSGTINIGFNGTNLQYVNGAGNLTTFPTLTGFVPYTGATANVDLGVYDLTADLITGATGSFASNGGSDTFAINHSSGGGIALNITKGGSGEGLYINKTSGSGNAATIIGTLEATTLVKSGGTSSQFLKADGTVDSNTYALDSAVVHNTGNETIGGTKTFSNATKNNGGILLQNGSTSSTTGYMNLGGTLNGFRFTNDLGITNSFNLPSATGYTFTFPSATGTIALTSDISYPVTSVFGRTGAVVATSGDYTTAQVTESGNLYFTDSRARLALSAGTGISYNNTTGVITNSAPDQTVSLTAGAGISVSGSYPSFTIASTITQYTDALARAALSFAAGSGAYNSTTGVITIPTDNSQIANGAGYITSSALSGYLPLTGGTLTGALNINLSSGTAMNVAGNAIFRGDTGVGTPRQLIITSGGSTPVYLEAKGYGANYQTDFGIKTFNSVGTAFEVFYADSSGRVGINQTSPSYQLDVNGTGRFSGALTGTSATFSSTLFVTGGSVQILNSSASLYSVLNLQNTGASGRSYDIGLGGNTSAQAGKFYIYDNTASALRFTIDSTGAATFSGFVGINGSPATGFPLEAYINSSTAYSSTSRGNVMRVYNSNTGANVYAGIELGGAGPSNDGLVGINGVVTAAGSGALTFYTRDSNTFAERMRITSGGNVGIGTSSPSAKLDINGNGGSLAATAAIVFEDGNSGGSRRWSISNGAGGNAVDQIGKLIIGVSTSLSGDPLAGNAVITMTSGGNVLIGTTTDAGYKLYVDGGSSNGMAFYSTSAANQFKIAGTAAAMTFSNTISGPSMGGSLGVATSAGDFLSGTAAGDTIFINQFSGKRLYAVSYSGGVYLSSGATSWTANSDIRLKNINSHIENAVEKLSTLQTINFSYKDDKTNKQNLGLIAQEVEKIFPELIDKNGDGMLGVRYTELVPVLIKAVQELKLEIETLKNK